MRVCASKLTQTCSTSVARPAVVRNSMALRRAASLFAKPVSQQLGFSGQPLAATVGFTKSRRISTTVFAAQEERLNGTFLEAILILSSKNWFTTGRKSAYSLYNRATQPRELKGLVGELTDSCCPKVDTFLALGYRGTSESACLDGHTPQYSERKRPLASVRVRDSNSPRMRDGGYWLL